jgi:hypothetical protein
MEITLTTPALLFPAVSLLLLAYTNRFLALAALIRSLHAKYRVDRDGLIAAQIATLRYRVALVRNMQAMGVSSLLLCVLCMFVLFQGWTQIGKYIFGFSLILLMASLVLSIREILVSVYALNLELSDMESQPRANSMFHPTRRANDIELSDEATSDKATSDEASNHAKPHVDNLLEEVSTHG